MEYDPVTLWCRYYLLEIMPAFAYEDVSKVLWGLTSAQWGALLC